MGWVGSEVREVEMKEDRGRASQQCIHRGGASTETRRQVGCEVAKDSRTARGGVRASEELWTGMDLGAELIVRMCKERECKGGKDDGKKERDGRVVVGWTENNSISAKDFARVFMRVSSSFFSSFF